jgi:antitoxin YefM
MPITASYTEARDNFAKLWDQVIENREMIRLQRRGTEDVVLIAADELESLLESAYLLRSPNNAARLNSALHHALTGVTASTTLDDLRRELGVAEEAAQP